MYIYIYIYIYVCMYVYMYICLYTSIYLQRGQQEVGAGSHRGIRPLRYSARGDMPKDSGKKVEQVRQTGTTSQTSPREIFSEFQNLCTRTLTFSGTPEFLELLNSGRCSAEISTSP